MSPNKIMLFYADSSKTQMITNCLSKSGYKIVHAAHGIGALDTIHKERPNLIILDFKLPGMNSLAIIRDLRSEEINGRTPIILMGEIMNEDDTLMGLEVGADLCLLEAFHPQVFIARVRSLIRRAKPAKVYDIPEKF